MDELTRTERLIISEVAQGRTNREIGEQLLMKPKTVEWNLTRIYRKLGLRSRTELAVLAVRTDEEAIHLRTRVRTSQRA